MAILKLNSQIASEETKVFLDWNGVSGLSFEDVKSFISEIPEDDKLIDIRINCKGGDCVEGWAMYDALRQSGKEIKAVIEGECSSMATAILLAAPLENRIAYPNAHLCIHNPFVMGLNVDMPATLTADNIDAMADQMKHQSESLREEQERILNLYVERTGTDAETLQSLMNEDRYINMNRAKELGFVSTILAPNTAHKISNKMNKAIKDAFVALASAMGINGVKMMNAVGYDYAVLGNHEFDYAMPRLGYLVRKANAQYLGCNITPAGEELVVEREDGEPQVGDAASPDGEFILEDGTKIVVENGIITDIVKPEPEADPEPEANPAVALVDPKTGDELTEEDAQKLINEQNAKIAELEDKIAELENANEEANAKAMTEEQKAICDKVNECGGMSWIENVLKMQSGKFHVQNNTNGGDQKIGAGFLANHKNGVFRK